MRRTMTSVIVAGLLACGRAAPTSEAPPSMPPPSSSVGPVLPPPSIAFVAPRSIEAGGDITIEVGECFEVVTITSVDCAPAWRATRDGVVEAVDLHTEAMDLATPTTRTIFRVRGASVGADELTWACQPLGGALIGALGVAPDPAAPPLPVLDWHTRVSVVASTADHAGTCAPRPGTPPPMTTGRAGS